MSQIFNMQTRKTAQVRHWLAAGLMLASGLGTITTGTAQVTPPPTPAAITPPVGNVAFLAGRASGSQGYTCLPTANGGTAWNPAARPEATLVTDLFGQHFQIITHFLSINEGPNPGVQVPLSGNATWQSSLDRSRVWAVKASGIDPSADIKSCSHTGSIPCLLLQTVGTKKGPTGSSILANTTFIQRLNTQGGSVPTTACSVGQTQLVPYSADYFFYRKDETSRVKTSHQQ